MEKNHGCDQEKQKFTNANKETNILLLWFPGAPPPPTPNPCKCIKTYQKTLRSLLKRLKTKSVRGTTVYLFLGREKRKPPFPEHLSGERRAPRPRLFSGLIQSYLPTQNAKPLKAPSKRKRVPKGTLNDNFKSSRSI